MKRIRDSILFLAMAVGLTGTLPAQSTFSGTFVHPLAPDLTAICGGVRFTVGDGQVVFQSTLFQSWAAGVSLEPVLVILGEATPFSFGVGTPGNWELGEFFGAFPGVTPVPPDEDPIDPGFGLPVYFDGVRFSGSFTAPDGLEEALFTSGGTLQLQIHGTVNVGGSPIQDPLISAVMMPVPEPSTVWLLVAGGLFLALRPFLLSGSAQVNKT